MLSTFQICLLSIIGVLAVASIVFMIMFIVEITVEPKIKTKIKRVSIKEVIEKNKDSESEEVQISVDEMLENLEKQSKEDEVLEDSSENLTEKEESIEVVVEEVDNSQNATEEIVVEEKVEEITEEVVAEEKIEETAEEVVVEEKIEEKTADSISEDEDSDNEDSDNEESDDEESEDEDDDVDVLSYEKMDPIVIAPGSAIDYRARREKVISNKEKLEKDLAKIEKFVLKYERTDRRKVRNQKMLDRRAGELTNLNLVMYSVTDIKNVDEEKKIKQEELTAHIAELKASIQDAEEYLESNKEKYNHNLKMAKFLRQERARFSEEIVELDALIKTSDENK